MMSTGHDGDVHISVFCDVIRYPSGCIPQSVVPPSSRRCGRLRAGSLPARARKALLASDHSSIERTPFFFGPYVRPCTIYFIDAYRARSFQHDSQTPRRPPFGLAYCVPSRAWDSAQVSCWLGLTLCESGC